MSKYQLDQSHQHPTMTSELAVFQLFYDSVSGTFGESCQNIFIHSFFHVFLFQMCVAGGVKSFYTYVVYRPF